MNLGEPRLFQVFQACEELGMAVFVHPWDMMGADRMDKYWMPWLVGMPVETTTAITVHDLQRPVRAPAQVAGGLRPRWRFLPGHHRAHRARLHHAPRPVCGGQQCEPPRDYLGRFWIDALGA
jgi:aminocarboxymuconate-semialdehyde decarboxylase